MTRGEPRMNPTVPSGTRYTGRQSGDLHTPATHVATPTPLNGRGLVLVLPLPTPSQNSLWGHHWSKKARQRKQWGWMVRAERLRLQKLGPLPTTVSLPVQITVDRYGPRILDHDNFVAGAKQLIDALVAEGFLVDDSPVHLQATYRQHVGKPYRTEVRIE